MNARRGILVVLAFASLMLPSCTTRPPTPVTPAEMTDDAFLDMVERDSVQYYIDRAHPSSGLISFDGKFTHVGSNGYGLTALCIAAERGWISREEAAERVLRILHTFSHVAATHHGAFLWITDAESARDNEYNGDYDLVETAYVVAGGLVCKQYFDKDNETESKIREQADKIYRSVRFDEFRKDGEGILQNTLAWGCDVETKSFGGLRIMGYNECMIVYILALGSPTHPVPAECWEGWAGTYKWKRSFGQQYFFCPALFTHQYSQAWLDLRKFQDKYTGAKGITYFENSRRAALSHIEYARQNPEKFPGYGPVWGLTDCGCPLHPSGFGEHGLPWAGGAAPAHDDGTVAVTGAGSCLPFTPRESIDFLRHIHGKFGARIYDQHGFKNAFNEQKDWFDPNHDALNKGAFVAMIENYRSGLVWKLFMQNEEVQAGMKKAGFKPVR